MTTISQLTPANAVADGDLVPVWHGTVTYKATRAQLVAGLQPSLGVPAGKLVGRTSPGTGAPEAVSLGANLSLSGGVLSATTSPLDVTTLPAGVVPSVSDLVPLSQGGRNVRVSYGQFLGGIAGAGAVNVSPAAVTATGGSAARTLADIAADAVAVEAFGAKGDGVSDDTAAFAAAVAAGVPVRLGARTYVVNGQFTIARAGVTFLGVPGLSILKRGAQAGNGAWISIQADGFRADGVVFDANAASVQVESWGVLVTAACLHSDFHRCTFRNAYGSSLGSGLVLLASDPQASEHVIRDCAFHNNAAHGLWVQAVGGVLVSDCRAHDNASYGIVADFNDATFARKARLGQISTNRAWNNVRGISVGNFNATNTTTAVWGNANPDAIAVLVQGNVCHDNTIYGISAAGQGLALLGNVLSNNGTGVTGGAGILANVAASLVADNVIAGSATYGIDSGGSQRIDLRGNSVTGGLYGINCGGSVAVRVEGNAVQDFTVAGICVANVETDGVGVNFNQATSQVSIAGNWIGMNGTAGGVWLRDGPQLVMVARNHFAGTSDVGNCLWADTDSVTVEGNRYNFSSRFIANPSVGSPAQIVVPDIADSIMVTSASAPITSMISSRQAQQAGRISFIRVTAGGAGYTTANVAIGGSGAGATANAFISNGAVIGFLVQAPGSGYGNPGTIVPVTITGNGSGATATAYAGPPIPEERRLRIRCNQALTFQANATQQNWTGADLTLPAASEIDWTGTFGAWRASRFPAATALSGPTRLTTPTEPTGCTSSIGRGNPEGIVTANPGSDWRNLDGGAGSTWYIKRTGSGPTGWSAIA
jgi:hypothetical protein